jgi:pimeloyl-ACP methyl ester carboxylesterase
VTATLAGLDVPTLVLGRADDGLMPLDVRVGPLVEAPLPHAERVVVAGSGHLLFLEGRAAFCPAVAHRLSARS